MTAHVSAETQHLRVAYPRFVTIPTRWADVDDTGHVSAAVCCTYFDTAIHGFLLCEGGPEILLGQVYAHPQEAFCRFHRPILFPQVLDAGLRVSKLGEASVRYEIGLFREGEDKPAVSGFVAHVFVDRDKSKPASIPPRIRACLEGLVPVGRSDKVGDPTRRCG
ncbi:MAG: thioesterase family protein [Rhodocyclaceae bacterium]